MSKTFVIAEAGSSWRYGPTDQHMNHAFEAIKVAKQADAQACKFQWTSNPLTMEKRRKVKRGSYNILAWPWAWIRELHSECERVGIEFMCTVFLPEDAKIVAPYLQQFKVASLEATDYELLKACANEHEEIIISLGAMTDNEIQRLMDWGDAVPNHISYLQCTATYPCSLDSLNLKTIGVVFSKHGTVIGLSDHSGDPLTGAVAVGKGAKIIEVHFRLDGTPMDNPDFPHSHEPASLREYVRNIRKAELMLGDGIKKVQPSEKAMLKHRVRT